MRANGKIYNLFFNVQRYSQISNEYIINWDYLASGLELYQPISLSQRYAVLMTASPVKAKP